MVEYVVEPNTRSRETPLCGVNRLGAIRRVPLSMIGGRLIEAFSPGVEKAIFECQFVVDRRVLYAKRRFPDQFFSTRKTCTTVFQPLG